MDDWNSRLEVVRKLTAQILAPLKEEFVGKDEVIDLMGICLVAGEHLFLLGPPGTAKSALVNGLGDRLQGQVFDYLLTRFTEPNELFGPFDIRRLREGELVTNTEGMLPEASFVFLDELLNANSAVLNSLLMVLNERVFRRGRETRKLPLLMAVAASNHLPDDEVLRALFDRFLVRVECNNVSEDELHRVLSAGWNQERKANRTRATVTIDEIRKVQETVPRIDIATVLPTYVELIRRLRHAGIPISDRRAVKSQKLLAASALLAGRTSVVVSDVWPLKHTWEKEEHRPIIDSIVQSVIDQSPDPQGHQPHPRARQNLTPDPETLAVDFERLDTKLNDPQLTEPEQACLRDQLAILTNRVEWVTDPDRRSQLVEIAGRIWPKLESRM